MPSQTAIQWCHSTVNPVMGCDGCPLLPTRAEITQFIADATAAHAGHRDRTWVKGMADVYVAAPTDGDIRTRAEQALTAMLDVFAPGMSTADRCEVFRQLGRRFRCYAFTLHHRLGAGNPGYARVFDKPQQFPGRMAEIARLGAPTPAETEAKPWLAGIRRMIFVSDMGDALSANVPFEYLKQEIVDTVTTADGSRHIWLWLTKRPRRMADFADWLGAQGINWPANLVPMASVLNMAYARHAIELNRIPARVRGYSLEPLGQGLKLPDELLGPDRWLIAGGESGVGARDHPFELQWARDLRDQCAATGAAFFLKQLGGVATDNGKHYPVNDGHGGNWNEWPVDLRIRAVPDEFRAGSATATPTPELAAV